MALAGIVAFRLLPVSPLPQVDFPTVSVSASLPGASPEVMAATVATPLERLDELRAAFEGTLPRLFGGVVSSTPAGTPDSRASA